MCQRVLSVCAHLPTTIPSSKFNLFHNHFFRRFAWSRTTNTLETDIILPLHTRMMVKQHNLSWRYWNKRRDNIAAAGKRIAPENTTTSNSLPTELYCNWSWWRFALRAKKSVRAKGRKITERLLSPEREVGSCCLVVLAVVDTYEDGNTVVLVLTDNSNNYREQLPYNSTYNVSEVAPPIYFTRGKPLQVDLKASYIARCIKHFAFQTGKEASDVELLFLDVEYVPVLGPEFSISSSPTRSYPLSPCRTVPLWIIQRCLYKRMDCMWSSVLFLDRWSRSWTRILVKSEMSLRSLFPFASQSSTWWQFVAAVV